VGILQFSHTQFFSVIFGLRSRGSGDESTFLSSLPTVMILPGPLGMRGMGAVDDSLESPPSCTLERSDAPADVVGAIVGPEAACSNNSGGGGSAGNVASFLAHHCGENSIGGGDNTADFDDFEADGATNDAKDVATDDTDDAADADVADDADATTTDAAPADESGGQLIFNDGGEGWESGTHFILAAVIGVGNFLGQMIGNKLVFRFFIPSLKRRTPRASSSGLGFSGASPVAASSRKFPQSF